ncbi:MAG: hypothetical protein DWH85_03325 [Planctomycetota bacterium]|nr:MAG: hypothetical protein DWH85_03325 [Planctomycetota bacterium]
MIAHQLRLGLATCGLVAAMLILSPLGCETTRQVPSEPDWFEGGTMKPASPETLQLTARVLAAKGDTARAGYILDRMLQEFPNYLGTYTEGAEVLLIDGRNAEAIKWLNRGLERFPNQPILVNNRGMCHLLAADLPAATVDFNAAYAIDPNDAEYVANLALVKAIAGDETAAKELWSRVLPEAEVQRNIEIATKSRPNFSIK